VHCREETGEAGVRAEVDSATGTEVDARRVDRRRSAVRERAERSILRVDGEEFRVHRGGEASHNGARILRGRVELGGYAGEFGAGLAVASRDELATLRVSDVDETGVDEEGEELLAEFFDLLEVLERKEALLQMV
jgi:hypothetical protein